MARKVETMNKTTEEQDLVKAVTPEAILYADNESRDGVGCALRELEETTARVRACVELFVTSEFGPSLVTEVTPGDIPVDTDAKAVTEPTTRISQEIEEREHAQRRINQLNGVLLACISTIQHAGAARGYNILGDGVPRGSAPMGRKR